MAENSLPSYGSLLYRCNICGADCQTPMARLERESQTCQGCGSTPRFRSVIRVLSEELFGASVALPDFVQDKRIRGVGLSDWDGYARLLAEKFSYHNTFYHQEPRLDIAAIDQSNEGIFDFIIATEVFEHVPPPVSRAFQNARRMLRPGGFLVLTVPYSLEENTREHFPTLHQFEILGEAGNRKMRNMTADGREEIFENLVFHGGDGLALEMRLFSQKDIMRQMKQAGFSEVHVYQKPDFTHGVYWAAPWSHPMVGRTRARLTEEK